MAKKKDAVDNKTPTGSSTTGSNTILYACAAIIVLIALCATALYFLMAQTSETSAAKTLRDYASAQAKTLNNQVNQLTEHMEDLASKKNLITAFEKNDTVALEKLARQIRDDHEYTIDALLIPHGRGSDFALRFAELDQVRQTEDGDRIPPEAIATGDESYFIISVPVRNISQEKILGTLFMSYQMERIMQPLEGFDHSNGSTSLVQVFEGAAPRVITTVGGHAPSMDTTQLIQAGETRWHILFTASPEFYRSRYTNPIYLLVTLGVLGVSLATVVILLLRRYKKASTMLPEDTPIQIASARTITKKTAYTEDSTAVEDTGADIAEESMEDFNEISDPLFQAEDILDIAVVDDNEFEETVSAAESAAAAAAAAATSHGGISGHIFRNYDIRGEADTYITDDAAYKIGQSLGSEVLDRGESNIVVAADGRMSSPRIKEKLVEGLLSTGINALDIGMVPTPLLYFVTYTTDNRSGVIVTASHNPAPDNGFKIVLSGKTATRDDIIKLRDRIDQGDFASGSGSCSEADYKQDYIDEISADIALAGNLKIVLDCANGIAGELGPELFEELGCDVVPLYCDVDGRFLNHDPDPSVEENLANLVETVRSESADLGIALDGDGDRLVAVSSSGVIVQPDKLLMLFAKDIVSRNPGIDIVFDVKCTRRLNSLISGYGGRPLMWKSGHSNIKNKMLETGALLGGEFSGHIFFKERWHGFDDGLYATARLLEILTIRDQDLDSVLSTFPTSAITPEIRIPADEESKFTIVEKLVQNGEFSGGKISTLDGLRVDFAKGWGLVRASNTSAHLTLRFEADNDDMLKKITTMFKEQLGKVAPELKLNF